MKQILQDLSRGTTELVEVPCPAGGDGQLLVRTTRSLISAGTERMLIEFGKANPIEKARLQPDKVRVVLNKISTDGLIPTMNAVRNKLDQPLALGYCNVGRILDGGENVAGFSSGDRVASNGKHAEVVAVPTNLCARIPASVTDDEAAFTVIGAIALQGIRLANPTLGESVVVTGLGLIGQMTVQLLRANGCRVLGIDLDPMKLELARRFGAETVNVASGEDPIAAAERFSRGRGIDAVIVTAATKSSEIVHQAALMCRKRGRIVLVGIAGLELSRDDFYKKELSFQVSCSYGPGRYDSGYEEKGLDYPVGYVRWTEQRNFEAVLDMMAQGSLDVKALISHRFPLQQFDEAYELVASNRPSLGILLEYPSASETRDDTLRIASVAFAHNSAVAAPSAAPGVAFVGAGNYATAVLIPAFKTAGARLVSIASNAGVSGVHAGKKYGFQETTTDTSSVFVSKNVSAVVIATRHDSHARFVLQALEAGKHVFAEKPLCMTLSELAQIETVAGARPAQYVMVGFNRRFAPHVQKMRALLAAAAGPKSFVLTVNAGAIAADHWTQDPIVGGGRVVGEVCHFVDLLRFLAGSPIVGYGRTAMNTTTGDTLSLQLTFADGSIGTIHYFSNGSKAFPKERLDVFAQGRVLQLDNFRVLRGFGWPGFTKMRLWRQDKGQRACAASFVSAIRNGGVAPIPLAEIIEVSRVTIQLATNS